MRPLDSDLDVYGSISSVVNCDGRGRYGTWGVRFDDDAPEPSHWHDTAADRFGYPRLSCQLTVEEDCTVELPVMWGQLLPRYSRSSTD